MRKRNRSSGLRPSRRAHVEAGESQLPGRSEGKTAWPDSRRPQAQSSRRGAADLAWQSPQASPSPCGEEVLDRCAIRAGHRTDYRAPPRCVTIAIGSLESWASSQAGMARQKPWAAPVQGRVGSQTPAPRQQRPAARRPAATGSEHGRCRSSGAGRRREWRPPVIRGPRSSCATAASTRLRPQASIRSRHVGTKVSRPRDAIRDSVCHPMRNTADPGTDLQASRV